ncbi:MAG: hypothetical protein NBV65_05745 [Burkholderiaceae bacterium]|nr:hypothetical protein [Burkholderiaceae bacterium]
MRPLSAGNQPAEKPKLSAHDKKILKRVDKIMTSANQILDTQKLKLHALIFLTDVTYGAHKPDMDSVRTYNKFVDKINAVILESGKPENQREFKNLVKYRLAEDGLAESYNEYVQKMDAGTDKSVMAAWIHEKLQEISRPVMHARSVSQPVLPVSTSPATPSSEAATPNPFGLPDGTSIVVSQVDWQAPDNTSHAPFIPSSARSKQYAAPYPQTPMPLQQQLQPQPQPPIQPQPSQPSAHITANSVPCPNMAATPPQLHGRQFPDPATAVGGHPHIGQPSVTNGALPVRATFIMLGAVAELEKRGFNREGYVALLQHLVAGWLPSQNHTESHHEFNEQFHHLVQWMSAQRATVDLAQHRLWTDHVAVYLVGSVYGLELAEPLENQLRQGMDRSQIASWLQAAIPR